VPAQQRNIAAQLGPRLLEQCSRATPSTTTGTKQQDEA
jgi:hypothetical protein